MSSHFYSLFGIEPLVLKGKFAHLNVAVSSDEDVKLQAFDNPKDKLHVYGWFRDLLTALPDSHAFHFMIGDEVEVKEGRIMLPDTILTAIQKRKLWDQLKDYV